MTNASKNKGNGWERTLAKTLTEIFGGNFTRVPSSGSFVGGKQAYRQKILSETQNRIYRGDLIPPDHMKKMIIEAKNYANFPFHQLMTTGYCRQLDEWITQVLETVMEGDVWFICFKITRIGTFVAFPFGQEYELENCCIYNGKNGKVNITELEPFLRKNKNIIQRLCE